MNKFSKILSCGLLVFSSCIVVNADADFLDTLKNYFSGEQNNNNKSTSRGNITVDFEHGFANIFKAVSPSVVSIFTVKEEINNDFNLSNLFDNFFNNEHWGFSFNFGNDGFKFNQNNNNAKKSINAGSGFCVGIKNNNLYIATNYHVVNQANEIAILFGNDRLNNANNIIKAKVHGTDPKNDIAVLVIDIDDLEKNTNIKKSQIQCIEWGSSNNTEVGELVLAIGNPFAIGLSASSGIISAKNRNTNIDSKFAVNNNIIENCIQHTAAINYGNSGGVLVNTKGQIIGINTAIYSPNGGNVGVGFAIPSDTARIIIDSLIEYQRTLKGWIGINIQELSYDEAKNLGVLPNNADKLEIKPKSFGAIVSQVISNSPADKSGIKPNDIIVAFNDKLIDNNNPLYKLINDYEIGKNANLLILRKNKQTDKMDQVEIKVTIYDYDKYYGNNQNNNRENIEELNIVVEDTFRNNENQVVVTRCLNQNPSNDWFNWGSVKMFYEGDIITQVNGNNVKNAKQLSEFIRDYYNKNPNGTITFSIIRQDRFNNESHIVITKSKLRK